MAGQFATVHGFAPRKGVTDTPRFLIV